MTDDCYSSEGSLEDYLDELPPSAKLVFKVLEYRGRMTQKELVEETRLSKRTTRYALNRLKERDLVTQEPCYEDMRSLIYKIEDNTIEQIDGV